MFYVLSEWGIEKEFNTEVEASLYIDSAEDGDDLWIASDEDGEPFDEWIDLDEIAFLQSFDY